MLTLTPELREAVEQAHGGSVYLVDPNTAQRYQLVPVFESSDNIGAIASSVGSHDADLQDRLTEAKELAGCLKVPLGREAEFAQIATGSEFCLEASCSITTSPAEGIEITPDVCGGDARIAGTRIPIWGLVQARRLGMSEDELLRCYPRLQPTDLVHAWAYADAHASEIERQIIENETA